jgi:hypothetical protein
VPALHRLVLLPVLLLPAFAKKLPGDSSTPESGKPGSCGQAETMMRYASDRYLTAAISGLLIATLLSLGAISVWCLKPKPEGRTNGDKPVADLALRGTLP